MPYCDHNATSELRPLCREAIAHALAVTGNPSSIHAHGRAARAIVEEARERIAGLVKAKPDQVIFTSGATEANNLALWGAMEGAGDLDETENSARITRLLISAIEHSSVLKTAEAVTARVAGLRLEILPVNANGVIDLKALDETLRKDNSRTLVAVMAANNETGVIQPIAEVSRLCRETGALLLVDAVPAAGKIDLDAELCDYLTLSAHKLGGPQGVGALIVGANAQLVPQITGGGQQKGLRGGTENLSGIAGFGAAVAAMRADGDERTRIASVRDYFERTLKAALPQAALFGAGAMRLNNTSNFAVPGLKSENMVMALDLDGVMVSSGSSCSSGKIAPSHVLEAMGVAHDLAGAAIRVSFGWNSVKDDAEAVVASLVKLAARVCARQAA